MANPYSAGTLTLQEAPSFAWRTNGLALSCLARLGVREATVGFNAVLASRLATHPQLWTNRVAALPSIGSLSSSFDERYEQVLGLSCFKGEGTGRENPPKK